ncbi:hypothetical protein CSUI_005709 [Cystoisospora suis]|uniref:Transmembrane protein n=1 Tax=Cystoisospora suis TaxID=483139 RepID=A0A2C6KW52_9APIC|nr:hypothetical protein CSUI_005709 [Cystoisospora suis]
MEHGLMCVLGSSSLVAQAIPASIPSTASPLGLVNRKGCSLLDLLGGALRLALATGSALVLPLRVVCFRSSSCVIIKGIFSFGLLTAFLFFLVGFGVVHVRLGSSSSGMSGSLLGSVIDSSVSFHPSCLGCGGTTPCPNQYRPSLN